MNYKKNNILKYKKKRNDGHLGDNKQLQMLIHNSIR